MSLPALPRLVPLLCVAVVLALTTTPAESSASAVQTGPRPTVIQGGDAGQPIVVKGSSGTRLRRPAALQRRDGGRWATVARKRTTKRGRVTFEVPAQAGEWRISFRAVRHAGRRHPARRTRPASYQPRPGTPGYVWQPRSQLVSRAVGVLTPDLGAGDAAISADGRYVAYTSYSGDLPGATPDNGYADVFRYDRQTGATLLVSSGAGAPGNGDSWGADISADGSVIVFTSRATNLRVAADGNGRVSDVYRWRASSGIDLISVDVAGGPVNDDAGNPSLSADGRWIAWSSVASDISISGDTNSATDVFLTEADAGVGPALVSHNQAGTPATGFSDDPRISADGSTVVFGSGAADIVAGDTNAVDDVFAYDRASTVVTVVSRGPGGTLPTRASRQPDVSGDGRYVVYASASGNLADPETDNDEDVFLTDRTTGVTTRVSRNAAGGHAGGSSYQARISANGRVVAFKSDAADIVPGDTNGYEDVFVRLLASGTNVRVSVNGAGGQVQGGNSYLPDLSADGRWTSWESFSTDVLVGDVNDDPDVFLTDLGAQP